MAAMADPGKSNKVQVRSCHTCTTRLSELCYDTHTLCEKCRGQVCGYDSFCDECRSWTKDFRRLYLKHQRTLHQKHVSKGNAKAKAKSPPVVDDAASNVSLESLASVSVVILPLDSRSVNFDDNLSNLGDIQNVDNVVEIQSQPEVPPPTSAVFDAGTIASAFEKIHELLDKFKGRSTPPPENVGSVRRSPTAGPSDIARPNPLAQVTDSAPQGPDAAPGHSMATHVPPAPGPSHHAAHSSGVLKRTIGSRFTLGVVEIRPQRDCVIVWSLSTRRLLSIGRSLILFGPVECRLPITIIVILIFSTPSMTVLARQILSHVRLPHPVAVGVLQTLLLQVSLLQLRLPVLHVKVLRHTQGFAIHLSLGLPHPGINDSLHKTFLVHETSRAIVPVAVESHKIAHVSDSSLAISLATGGDSLQGIPPLQSADDSLRMIPLHLSVGTHPVPFLVMVHLRDPHRGLLMPFHLRLLGKIGTLMILPSLPQFGRWSTSSSRVFLSLRLLLPNLRQGPLSASAGVTDVAIPPGSLLAWSHALSDSFSETQQRFARRIKDGKACHTILPTLNKFERVSNSPTQGKELRANPDVLDLLRSRVPDSRYVPLSLKEAAALERTLRSVLESHNFLTWSVVPLIRSLHEKKLLPKDDQIISQLQKSFSKACGNVASGISSSAAFFTLKRRQLLLSHVVPSVSDEQKRNLLSDPFFQTGSLFSSSSVEAARSVARDLSLFKPHLKALSSTTQARRSGYSSSSAQRGPARSSSAQSSAQRSSSPLRPQSGKKGDSRFQKKSSGPHQKRGGFRR